MGARHLLSITDLGPRTLARLVKRSAQIAAGGGEAGEPLAGKIVGIFFRGPSTRTRTSFTVASLKLGANVVTYGPADLQVSTGETLEDTGRVLSGYLDALVVRTNGSVAEMNALASQGRMTVINAMSEVEHPTQAIADLSTLLDAFGELAGLHVLYVGEGNNSAASLALATALTPGMTLTVVTPEGYGMNPEVLAAAEALAAEHGAAVREHHDADQLPRGVDAVYATRWQTMGEPKTDPGWRELFQPYSVTSELMERVSKPSGTVFLHDLPAVRGEDVVDEVLDGPQSIAFRQARHKLWSAMAVLEWSAGPEAGA